MRPTRWKTLFLMMLYAIALLSGFGCLATSNRVVYVPDGTPMRLGQKVKARVWVKGADGKEVLSDNEVEINEGWYVLADPGPAKTK